MKRAVILVILAATFSLPLAERVGAQAFGGFPPASPSPALLDALDTARSGAMPELIAWAGGSPSPAGGAAAAAEGKIMALAPADRDALLYWLGSHGRGPLHAQGVSDARIGVPYYAIDYSIVRAPWPASVVPLPAPPPPPTPPPTPQPAHHSNFLGVLGGLLSHSNVPIASSSSSSSSTSTSPDGSETTTTSSSTSVSVGVNPGALLNSLVDSGSRSTASEPPASNWRAVVFASSTLGTAGAASQIAVTHGFAAYRYDGTQGLACLSFANQAQKPASEVDFDLEIVDGWGFIRQVEALRVPGNFDPGAPSNGPGNVRDVHGPNPNCAEEALNGNNGPFVAMAGASAVVYSVRRVLYADGTSWLLPGANVWP